MTRLRVWISLRSTVAALTVMLLAVPTFGAKEQKAQAPEASAKADLNTASQAELEKLPGIGEAMAKKIIAGRPYASVADLSKAGVPGATIKKLAPLVTVGAPTATSQRPTKAEKAPAKATTEQEKKPGPVASTGPKGGLDVTHTGVTYDVTHTGVTSDITYTGPPGKQSEPRSPKRK